MTDLTFAIESSKARPVLKTWRSQLANYEKHRRARATELEALIERAVGLYSTWLAIVTNPNSHPSRLKDAALLHRDRLLPCLVSLARARYAGEEFTINDRDVEAAVSGLVAKIQREREE